MSEIEGLTIDNKAKSTVYISVHFSSIYIVQNQALPTPTMGLLLHEFRILSRKIIRERIYIYILT